MEGTFRRLIKGAQALEGGGDGDFSSFGKLGEEDGTKGRR
jgi:hypothetical protein